MKTFEFINGISILKNIENKKYRKIVHVNGEKASLFFYVEDISKKLIPLFGTDYKKCDFYSFEKLPNFIKRHIDLEIMQDYFNSREMRNYKKYPFGLYFENGNLIKL